MCGILVLQKHQNEKSTAYLADQEWVKWPEASACSDCLESGVKGPQGVVQKKAEGCVWSDMTRCSSASEQNPWLRGCGGVVEVEVILKVYSGDTYCKVITKYSGLRV